METAIDGAHLDTPRCGESGRPPGCLPAISAPYLLTLSGRCGPVKPSCRDMQLLRERMGKNLPAEPSLRSRARRTGADGARRCRTGRRSEEHTSELQSLMRISYAVFCLKKKTTNNITHNTKQYIQVSDHKERHNINS